MPDWNDDFPEWPTLKVRSFFQNDVEKQNIELIDIVEVSDMFNAIIDIIY